MAFLDKNGLQVFTNKLVQGDAIKVASHRGHTVKNVIDNIQRECENVATPNTMNLENRVSEFRVGKDRDVDVSGDVEEGKIEVELQGKTWQNVVHGKKSVQSNIFTIEDGKYVFNNNATSSGGIIFSLICKPNTTYTLIINFLECALGDNAIYIDGHPAYLSTINKHLPKTKGTHAISFVTKDDVTDKKMKLAILSSSTSKLVIDENIIVLEGDYTQTPIEELPKYFEEIRSSFEDGIVDVEVTGKNLLDLNVRKTNITGVTHKIIGNSIMVTSDSTSKAYAHVKLHYPKKLFEGKTMTFSCKASANSTSNEPTIQLYYTKTGADKGTWVPFWNKSNTHTFPDKIDGSEVIIQIHTHNSTNTGIENTVIIEELQAEVCNVKTNYEPYYKKKISFNIEEPLKSLPSGVCDEIRNNNGQWELIRRVEKVVIDGTDYVVQDNPPSQNSTIAFAVKQGTHSNTDNAPILNDKFINVLGDKYWNEDKECLMSASGKHFKFRILRSKLETEDSAGFKKWLSQNPTTVYYELETPIITPIEPMEFDVKPLATMTINSDIAPISNHKVVLNRAGQIEQGIIQIAELKSRVDALETTYDSYLLETQHKLSILGFEYELESEEI